jgi:hypothetical protein
MQMQAVVEEVQVVVDMVTQVLQEGQLFLGWGIMEELVFIMLQMQEHLQWLQVVEAVLGELEGTVRELRRIQQLGVMVVPV